MKYKFVSREQTKKDWEEGKVQCEYNGDLKKLIQLINIVSKECGAKGTDKYYFINKYKNWYSSKFPFENLPTATTDELYEWIYGEGENKRRIEPANEWETFPYTQLKPQEEQRELLGYKLNGKVDMYKMAAFLNTFAAVFPLKVGNHDELIALASELGVLSTCFEPVYKEREVVVQLSNGEDATVTKDTVYFQKDTIAFFPITDLKKIIEAHDKL